MQARRFLDWLRVSSALKTSSPWVLIEPLASRHKRVWARWLSGMASTAILSCALVDLLFTFCPPGPDERTKEIVIASVGTNTPGARDTPAEHAFGGVWAGRDESVSCSTVPTHSRAEMQLQVLCSLDLARQKT